MSNITLADLDFDLIKENLKTYLRDYRDSNGAPVFTDFDFEGSNWAILLDVLAYNTHMNAYLSNMILNEMFLDTAVKRASAVSLAKQLGYTPISARSARATLTFTVDAPTGNPTFLTLERYTPFTTTIDGSVYTFVNLNPITIQPKEGIYTFENIEVVEGLPLEYVFRVNVPGPSEKYEIPNDDVDTTTLKVSIQESFSSTTLNTYENSTTISSIQGSSKVYFLEESPLEKYQLYFGDGVIGNKLISGNLIRIQYLISAGEVGNVAENIDQIFNCATNIGGGTISTVTTVTNSHGGAAKESLASIKFNATRFVTTNDRAVTAEDYKALVQNYYPLAESVAAWGGEENNPPEYGIVYIALKPYEGFTISNSVKEDIQKSILNNKKLVTVTTKFIDPEYFYVNLTVNVKYNSKTISVSSNELKNNVIEVIQNYFSNDLQKFDKDFIFSKLSKNIDEVDSNVIGNLIKVKLQRRITPVLNTNISYSYSDTIKFNNAILPGTLSTTRFIFDNGGTLIPVRIYDIPDSNPASLTGTGTLVLKHAENNTTLDTNYGTVNYSTGEVSIPTLNAFAYPIDTNDIRLTFDLQDSALDIQVNKNQILVLDNSTLNAQGNRNEGLIVNTIATVI